MEKNTGKPYEILVQKIFGEILAQTDVETVKVERDVLLKGKTTTHQIDVYWEFKKGGVAYTTIVQAKDWAEPVSQGELLKFKGVLDDLPGQPRGVFVTKTGYQSGAKSFADANGILLYELREVTDEEFGGRIRTIKLVLRTPVPDAKNVRFVRDSAWIQQALAAKNLTLDEAGLIEIVGHAGDLKLYDADGVEVGTMARVMDAYFPGGVVELPETDISHEFPRPAFIKTRNQHLPLVCLKKVEATISVKIHVQQFYMMGEDMVHFILKNLSDGTVHLFGKQRNLVV